MMQHRRLPLCRDYPWLQSALCCFWHSVFDGIAKHLFLNFRWENGICLSLLSFGLGLSSPFGGGGCKLAISVSISRMHQAISGTSRNGPLWGKTKWHIAGDSFDLSREKTTNLLFVLLATKGVDMFQKGRATISQTSRNCLPNLCERFLSNWRLACLRLCSLHRRFLTNWHCKNMYLLFENMASKRSAKNWQQTWINWRSKEKTEIWQMSLKFAWSGKSTLWSPTGIAGQMNPHSSEMKKQIHGNVFDTVCAKCSTQHTRWLATVHALTSGTHVGMHRRGAGVSSGSKKPFALPTTSGHLRLRLVAAGIFLLLDSSMPENQKDGLGLKNPDLRLQGSSELLLASLRGALPGCWPLRLLRGSLQHPAACRGTWQIKWLLPPTRKLSSDNPSWNTQKS